MTPEEIHEWALRSRARQGLPPQIVDPEIVERVASLLLAGKSTTRWRIIDHP